MQTHENHHFVILYIKNYFNITEYILYMKNYFNIAEHI